MSDAVITARAPGKLFIAGEYAVVTPGEPSVLVAVDRYLTTRLTESTGAGSIHSPEYGQVPLVWTRDADGVTTVVDLDELGERLDPPGPGEAVLLKASRVVGLDQVARRWRHGDQPAR